MAPAPIARTAKALSVMETKPKVSNSGAMMADVVIIATVDDPWAVLSTVEIAKAIKRPPTPVLDSKLMIDAISIVLRIAPNAPPAPVISTIAPACLNASGTHSFFSSEGTFLPNAKAKKTPINNAITGLPKKPKTEKAQPSPNGWVG